MGSTITGFLWDGDNITAELDSSGSISEKYVYGLDMLADSDDNSYVYDIHGSVTGIVSSSRTKTQSYGRKIWRREL